MAINLLPWREYKREQEKRHFILYVFFSSIGVMTTIFFFSMYLTQQIISQTQRNEKIRQEELRFDQKIKDFKGTLSD